MSTRIYSSKGRVRDASLEPEVEYAKDDYQTEGVGLTQVLQRLVDTPVLQDLLIYFLSYLEGVPLSVLVTLGTMMSTDNQKRFEMFIHFASPKFSGPIGEDAYEFMNGC
ncbi:hypothetical protein FXO38_16992 [Capsicum annuum]|nr:hypothetical protein FXO38_16992 [Capsicum annuum]KAF3653041.1 hypothetical protein FXO37_17194 [Capsicum annuum]